jgi:hypothetical protein
MALGIGTALQTAIAKFKGCFEASHSIPTCFYQLTKVLRFAGMSAFGRHEPCLTSSLQRIDTFIEPSPAIVVQLKS